MALSYNDLQTKGWELITGTGNNKASGAVRLMAIGFAGVGAAATDTIVALFYNNTTTTGTNIQISGTANQAAGEFSKVHTFGPNGIDFDTGISIGTTVSGGATLDLVWCAVIRNS